MVHLVNHQVIGSIPTLSSQPNLSVGQLVAYSPWKRDVGGSSPPTQTKAIITQLVEYLPCKQEVIGSSPIDSTNSRKLPSGSFFYGDSHETSEISRPSGR